ncbi:MAG: radical SAM family heme chaperone HemW [Nanoarchaeota archaeon]|nr:radical SAM family heme chaperone HemW [Nanoarchaeota archaeon]
MENELIKLARKKLKSYNLEEVYQLGIKKRRLMKGASSQIVVTYPPLSILHKINPDWIFKEDNKKDFTLYFHIPFCTGKCLYCGFSTYPNQSIKRVDEYIKALKEEVKLYLKHKQIKEAKIKSVYIGGGTPTYLSKEQLKHLLDFINSRFKIEKGTEFTIESSPETLDKEKLRILLENGVNRLSIGVQTFDDDILKLILRRHNSKEAISAYNLAREVGFKNINLDIIRGLPDMSLKKLLKDLEILEKLKPESISGYHLIVKPTAAIQKMCNDEPKRFPDEETNLLMHIMAMEKMKQLGYEHNPIDWFYLKSKVYEQQIHKWEEIINQLSFGLSVYGYINNVQYYNEGDINKYLELINEGKLPIKGGLELIKKEQRNRKFIFGLKTKINKEFVKKEFGEIPNEIKDKINKYKKLGLIEENEKYIKLTQKGALFADEICIEFYSEEVLKKINNF